jgi:hypothetical protein
MVLEMMIFITMLIYTVSLELQLPSRVTVHNQCSNIELISLIYLGNGAVCPKLSGQRIDIGARMNASFEINTTQCDFEGALLFELQRHVESDNQCNMDSLTKEVNKKDTTHVHMLVVWEVKNSKYFVHVALVEHTKEFTWNEDKLKKLYHENRWWLKEYDSAASHTWFIDDNMVLKTTFETSGLKENFELSISISEEEKDDYVIRPLYVNLER